MDPLFSTTNADFENEEQAASYDRWFRAEVQKSLDDPRPNIPHEQVMAEIEALMERVRRKQEALEASDNDESLTVQESSKIR
ncbi:antitoxin [Pseudomonas sp. Irchel s3f10]|uniref:type II toxin-antitoxin system RelB family antitoxin n=1 Tax=Pseudomonas sp. Irchel s3f10 TaxID=2009137 RepID=UPI000BA48532|nr:antitoxin [Pseudomonas sp. Irchel s3f10]